MKSVRSMKWLGTIGIVMTGLLATIVLVKMAEAEKLNPTTATEADESMPSSIVVITDISELPPEYATLTVGPLPEDFPLPEKTYVP